MLYRFLKPFIRLALRLFCPTIYIANKTLLTTKGPLVLVANHPNSFLDAIIICSVFKQPVYSLARGDAFKNKWIAKLLYALHMLPIYRLSEGKENLVLNDATFLQCQQILSNNGIILIFIEGICKQQYQLQPFKKGAARIVFEALQNTAIKQLQIGSVGIQYSSFTSFVKKVHIGIQFIQPPTLNNINGFAFFANTFNAIVVQQMQQQLLLTTQTALAAQILKTAKTYIGSIPNPSLPTLTSKTKLTKKILFYLVIKPVALVGFIFHIPFYIIVKKITQKLTAHTVFYHSVLFGLLLVTYPSYVLAIAILINTYSAYSFASIALITSILSFLLAYTTVFEKMERHL